MGNFKQCVFLYYPGADHLEQIKRVLEQIDLKPKWGSINIYPTTYDVVANLVPQALHDGTESWLLMHPKSVDQDILVIPFPPTNALSSLRDSTKIESYLRDLLGIIAPVSSWFPSVGYSNLTRYLTKRVPNHEDRNYPEHFQVIHLKKPLAMYLQKPEVISEPVREEGLRILFPQYTKRLELLRQEYLETLVDGSKSRQDALTSFESSLLHETNDLMSRLSDEYGRLQLTPSIVNQYENLLDEETKKFLRAAETIGHYAKQHARDQFDFTFAACGLWKAVERELNLSLIWHIRLQKGIGSYDRPLKFIPIGSGEPALDTISGVKFWCTDKEDSSTYRGIMFGDMQKILMGARRNHVADDLPPRLKDDISDTSPNGFHKHLLDIQQIRNRYSHITAMPYDKFKRIQSLVLDTHDSRAPMLKRVLDIKMAVLENIAKSRYKSYS